jgi:hypothetical protein
MNSMGQEEFYSALTLWKNGQIADAEMALIFFLYAYKIEHPKTNYKSHEPEILSKFQFKKIKEKALISLKEWLHGHWRLKLVDRILSPYEVLAYQAEGIRPVTMLVDEMERPVLHRKNALDFFCHDLEHGYMFFHDSELSEMQKVFFDRVKETLDSGLWDKYLEDKEKRKNFYYLISDMNTHKEHYKAYLNSFIPKDDLSKFDLLFA